MNNLALLGDEALALGAVDAGISAAYGYPGTPSTEIMEYLQRIEQQKGKPLARWSANEKAAYEEALGTSVFGKRVLVTMKHVGLNVAADAFVNSSLLDIQGGLVLAIADDPGMHSSQNEQDSRFYSEFAHVPCFEPTSQQEAYDMMAQAFDLSEELHVPVMVRLVTRLSHSRAAIEVKPARTENPGKKAPDMKQWMLLPAMARKQWHQLLQKEKKMAAYGETTPWNPLTRGSRTGLITTGLGLNYYKENMAEMEEIPSHLHIGYYPFPENKIRELASNCDEILLLEEGDAFVEKRLRAILTQNITIKGKLSGDLPREGELNPDNVRGILGLAPRETLSVEKMELPGRPPQLCKGCPHTDTYLFIKEVVAERKESLVTSDIGCYALGALPPLMVPETIVCMGASITMAKGAAEAGMENVMAVIGDSTFLHSGLTGLVDCVSDNAPVTIIIVDNSTVGMTGGQETRLESHRFPPVVEGLGVLKEHIRLLNPLSKYHEENKKVLREELDFQGVSVIIAVRECIEWLRKQKKGAK
ncbi:MAG: thiamine pyrophosphate-dependent enzyme [Spirochaetaceae bacterium]|jgi:indolepyruvate ferredoxin oxidoreductase alpha subunit|nr:thiamine pyrophosphate-dependent enzyme [Spirochaetaceae bacterium]